MSNLMRFVLLALMSHPAYAHGAPPDSVLLGILFVYLLPYLAGVWLTGKGNRVWFSLISMVFYTVSFGLIYLSPGLDTEDIIYFFLPFILIIIAFIRRKLKSV